MYDQCIEQEYEEEELIASFVMKCKAAKPGFSFQFQDIKLLDGLNIKVKALIAYSEK